jgi:hypothetical protein
VRLQVQDEQVDAIRMMRILGDFELPIVPIRATPHIVSDLFEVGPFPSLQSAYGSRQSTKKSPGLSARLNDNRG